jgi:hypothetical protein
MALASIAKQLWRSAAARLRPKATIPEVVADKPLDAAECPLFFEHVRPRYRTRERDEQRRWDIQAHPVEVLCSSLDEELSLYSLEDTMDLYLVLELAAVHEQWPQECVSKLIRLFFTFLKQHATIYFDHDPVSDAHPAGPWPQVLFVTLWLNYCQVHQFKKLSSIPLWFPNYPTRSFYMIDAVACSTGWLNRVSDTWETSFRRAYKSKNLQPVFGWWADSWLIERWAHQINNKQSAKFIVVRSDALSLASKPLPKSKVTSVEKKRSDVLRLAFQETQPVITDEEIQAMRQKEIDAMPLIEDSRFQAQTKPHEQPRGPGQGDRDILFAP